MQKNPDLRTAGRTLAQIRAAANEARPEEPPRPPVPPSRPLRVGDRVRVQSLNKAGVVASNPRKGRVEINVGGLRSRVKVTDCVLLDAPKVVVEARPAPQPSVDAPGGVRTSRNSCDLRGQRALEALEQVELFLDRLVLAGEPVAWILHGHGTGSLKQAVRGHLPSTPHVRSWRPANEDEGGDAWTRVTL